MDNALRTVLPELLALSASSPWLEDRRTHLRSTRTQIFTRFFPRCGIPDAFPGWEEYAAFVRFLIDTGSIREHTEIWWSVAPPGVPDRRDADLRRPARLRPSRSPWPG